jgi:hypothetical protein
MNKPETREYLRQVLSQSPHVSRAVIEQHQRLEERLVKLGVDVRPRYSLSPPLGGAVLSIYSGQRRNPTK